MNQRKPNRIAWYSLVLLLLLCTGILVMSTGTAYARYRSQRDADITFEVGVPEQICLGTPGKNNTFSPEEPQWKTVEGITRMYLAVANGTSDTDFAAGNQRIYLRFLGSVGLWTGESAAKISLLQPDGTLIPAKAAPIAEGTALYHAYGAGWIYSFQDEEGEELFWELPGGELSFVSLTVTIEDEALTTDSLLRTLVTGEVIGE